MDVTGALLLIRWDGLGPVELDHVRGRVAAREVASFAGRTGDVFTETAGSSAIWSPDGLALTRTGPDVGGIAVATLT